MGFKFRPNQKVDTANGNSGTIQFRQAGATGRQNKYVVDGTPYFEGELNPASTDEVPAKRGIFGRKK